MHSADRVKGSHAIAGCPSWNCAGQAVAELAVEFVAVLEQSEDRHPLVNLAKKRKIESLLADPVSSRREGAAFSAPTKRYNKVVKRDPEGDRCWIEVA